MNLTLVLSLFLILSTLVMAGFTNPNNDNGGYFLPDCNGKDRNSAFCQSTAVLNPDASGLYCFGKDSNNPACVGIRYRVARELGRIEGDAYLNAYNIGQIEDRIKIELARVKAQGQAIADAIRSNNPDNGGDTILDNTVIGFAALALAGIYLYSRSK